MTTRQRLQELLSPAFTDAPESVVGRLLKVVALELDAAVRDLERMRRTHWVDFAFRFEDLDRLAALVGVTRRPWETLEVFRERLKALVVARLGGAIGPRELRAFVVAILATAQEALGAVFVQGLGRYDKDPDTAYDSDPRHPRYRPLSFVEFPKRHRASTELLARGGRLPYLHRWTEQNQGMAETVARFTVTGMGQGRTAVPLLANLTTGDLVGYAGVLRVGQRLRISGGEPVPGRRTPALATLDDVHDVTGRVFSVSGFRLAVSFSLADADQPGPLLPRLARGANDWAFLAAGFLDLEGFDHVFFNLAGEELTEGVFDRSAFDRAVYPSGTLAKVAMDWVETEPAAFEVGVPRDLVITPRSLAGMQARLADGLRSDLEDLHAVGVRAGLRFLPFAEVQPQRSRLRLPWLVLDPEPGPVGVVTSVGTGAQFGTAVFGRSRFQSEGGS